MKRRLDILQGKAVNPSAKGFERTTERYQEMDDSELYVELDRLPTAGPEHELQIVCELLSTREEVKAEQIRATLESEEGRQRLGEVMARDLRERLIRNTASEGRPLLGSVGRLRGESEGGSSE